MARGRSWGWVACAVWAGARVAVSVLIGALVGSALPCTGQTAGLPLLLVLEGENDDDYFGSSVACAGDVDGNGWDEWVIGAHGWGSDDVGKVSLYSGSPTLDGIPELVIEGQTPYGSLGLKVAGLGDVNGDGFADLCARERVEDLREEVVRVVLGGADLNDLATFEFGEDVPFCHGFGRSISAGDMDCDGFDDVLVGAYDFDRVVCDGVSTALTDTTLTDSSAHWEVGEFVGLALIPNIRSSVMGFWPYYAIIDNSETTITVAASTPGLTFDASAGDPYSVRDYRKGAAYLYLGSSTPDNEPDLVVHGSQTLGFYGYAVAVVGDVDGNGCEDFVVGAYEDDAAGLRAGKAFLYLGDPDLAQVAAPALTISGPGDDATLGFAVSRAGDVNGDGFADFAVGVPYPGSVVHPGEVWVYLGPSPDATPDLVLSGGYSFGLEMAAGDIDGDGYDDLVVASPYQDDGVVEVFRGGPGMDSIADFVVEGAPGGYQFGSAVATADLDHDGSNDLVIGTYDSHVGSPPPYAGVAFVLSGVPTGLIFADGFESGGLGAWAQVLQVAPVDPLCHEKASGAWVAGAARPGRR
jgi:hypothetical protein